MNDLKYVIVIPIGMNELGARAIIFNGMINHRDVTGLNYIPFSAGFCSFDSSSGVSIIIKTWGRSESLGLESKEGDDIIIQRTLTNTHPIIGCYKTR